MIIHIEKILEDQIRPALANHGGNVELIDIDNGIVFIRLTGGCQGCSMSKQTLTAGIEKTIKSHFPDLKVMDLTDHNKGKTPYYKDHNKGKTPF